VIGHEFCGTVIDAGKDASLAPGARVVILPNIACQTCWYCRSGHINLCDHFVHIGSMRDGGAAELCVVPERHVLEIPDSLSFDVAVLAEPLACVLNGTMRAGVQPGQSALVLGAGPIGLLYAMLFKAAGARPLIVSEPSPFRARWAREVGADVVLDPTQVKLGDAVRELTEGRGADLAVDSVGVLLADAISSVRKAGRVLFFGLNERTEATIHPVALAYGEISVEGIYIARGTFPLAVRLLSDDPASFERLITHRLSLESIDEAIDLLRSGEAVKAVVAP
jgi:threonine dehydrogenase-like Zn-dependent dehydrogenase